MVLIIDGHLDIAMNALRYERDQRLPVAQIRLREARLEGDEPGTCTMTAREMRSGGVPLCVTTVIARTRPGIVPDRPAPRYGLDHPTQDMAYASAQGQLAYYEALARRGELTIIRTRGELDAHWSLWQAAPAVGPPPLGAIITMEGADPIVEPDEVHLWWARGLRTLMLAHFEQSCYAYGTPKHDSPEDGPLTGKGRALLKEMAKLDMPLDLTHLCERSFYEAIDAYGGPIYSSHSNCRALADSPRQLSDEQIGIIAKRGGVLGVVLCNGMLTGPDGWQNPRDQFPLSLVADHIDHICQLAGSTQHAAIGSDLDGGFGAEHSPDGLDTIADLHKLEPILAERGYGDNDIVNICHGNWLAFWRRVLPQ